MRNSLKELQKIELDILQDFIKVCNTLDLKYYMCGGTLLGTIRHKGFIPWDDDIDIIMPREDYEIFIHKGQKLLNKNYFIQTYETDKNYLNNYAKIRNSNTTFIETAYKDIEINHGVYIDIFPLDGCPNQKIQYKKIEIRKKLIDIQIDKYLHKEKSNNKKNSIIKKFIYFVSDLLYKRKTLRELQVMKDKMYKKYCIKDSKLVICYSGVYGEREIMKKEYIGNGKIATFEGIETRIPEKYDKYLERFYGDYMQLPPVEKRKTHHYTEVIDLEKPYTEYFKKERKVL